jgi:myo-inositol-1(or 4)-monophosphatase
MTPDDLAKAAKVAEHACDLARKEILPRFRDVDVEWKSDGSPVTEADRAAERVIRATLRDAYPDFGLLGEEYGEEDAPRAGAPGWIVDPIDGTISFARGLPLFGTLIALVEEGEPVMGLIDLPALGERYVGWKGGGCHCNGKPVRVSDNADLTRCIMSLGDPICFDWANARDVYDRVAHTSPIVRGYTDAFGHAMVISGRVDAMIDCDLSPWDAAATQILAVEAGGACVTRRGSTAKVDLIFGSPALVEQLSDFFTQSRD